MAWPTPVPRWVPQSGHSRAVPPRSPAHSTSDLALPPALPWPSQFLTRTHYQPPSGFNEARVRQMK